MEMTVSDKEVIGIIKKAFTEYGISYWEHENGKMTQENIQRWGEIMHRGYELIHSLRQVEK